MKTRKIIVEIICFVLLMNWFYEGIYKVANWPGFSLYVKHAPLVHPVWQVLVYGIPVGEIVLALMFLFPKQRVKALYISIGSFLGMVFWVVCVCVFTKRLFGPYHALWGNPTWLGKMILSLGLCWMAFIVLVLRNPKINLRAFISKSLRNTPANAH